MKLSDFRKQNGWTNERLAEEIGEGTTKSTVIKYQRGERIPRKEIMDRIFQITGGQVSANDFYGHPAVGIHVTDDCSEGAEQ